MSDTQQFEAFVKAYQNMVYTTALRLTGRESDAEETSRNVDDVWNNLTLKIVGDFA